MMPRNQWGGKETVEKRATKQKKANIEEADKIFAENEIENTALHSLSPNNSNGQNEKAINKHIPD